MTLFAYIVLALCPKTWSSFFSPVSFSPLPQIEEERMLVWDAEAHVSFLPETGALSMKSAAYTDSGVYRCIVNGSPPGDKKRECIVHLHVQGKE